MNPLTEKAREIKEQASITDFLARIGHHPKRINGNKSMYISMVRDSDTDASFSVNETLGAWYDFGLGKGGHILDLAQRLWPDLDFTEVLEKVQHICSLADLQAPQKKNPVHGSAKPSKSPITKLR